MKWGSSGGGGQGGRVGRRRQRDSRSQAGPIMRARAAQLRASTSRLKIQENCGKGVGVGRGWDASGEGGT